MAKKRGRKNPYGDIEEVVLDEYEEPYFEGEEYIPDEPTEEELEEEVEAYANPTGRRSPTRRGKIVRGATVTAKPPRGAAEAMKRAAKLRKQGYSAQEALKMAWKGHKGAKVARLRARMKKNPLALTNMAGRPGKYGLPKVEGSDYEMMQLSKADLRALGTKRAKAELARRAASRGLRADIPSPKERASKPPWEWEEKKGRGKASVSGVVTARFPGECAVCGSPIERGDEVMDSGLRGPKGGKKMAHVRCVEGRGKKRGKKNSEWDDPLWAERQLLGDWTDGEN